MYKTTEALKPFYVTFCRLMRRGFIFAVAGGFILFSYGCGGGGSSAGLGPGGGPSGPSFGEGISQPQGRKTISLAAAHEPKAGSVTQSSKAIDDITTDSVSVTVVHDGSNTELNGLVYNVVKEGDAAFTLNSSSNPREMTNSLSGVSDQCRNLGINVGINGVEMLQRVTAGRQGHVYVGVQTNHQGSGQDSNYLATGLHAFFPENLSDIADYEMGAFADGGDPFEQTALASLTGSVTYEGRVTGVFAPGAEFDIQPFTARVELTVNFDSGTVNGEINSVIDDFCESVDDEAPPVVTLASADIGDSQSGFFRDDTSMTYRDISFEGKWGGQFFGNGNGQPGSVAGTFGAQADDSTSILGVFTAFRQ